MWVQAALFQRVRVPPRQAQKHREADPTRGARAPDRERGVKSLCRSTDKTLEGRAPALVERADASKCEGIAARPNNPEDKVRELQRTLRREEGEPVCTPLGAGGSRGLPRYAPAPSLLRSAQMWVRDQIGDKSGMAPDLERIAEGPRVCLPARIEQDSDRIFFGRFSSPSRGISDGGLVRSCNGQNLHVARWR